VAKLIEYDVTDVEESSGGTGVKVPIGLRVGEIRLCEQRSAKTDGTPANDIRVGINMGSDYDWLFTYVGLGPESDWKLAEFVRAMGLKDKGKMDTDKMIGKLLRVKVNPGEYGGEYSPVAGRLFPAQRGDEVGSVSMSSQAAEEAGMLSHDGSADGEVQESEGTGTEGFVPSRESDPEVGSYDDWAEDDLLAEVEDRGLTLPGGRGAKLDKAIKALRADDIVTEEVDGEPEASANGDSADDYEEWEIEKLIAEYKDRQFEDELPAFRGRNAKERQKEAIVTALREDDEASPFEP
jgi:hypothetical protein